jgi:hypothetical protein
MINELIQQLEQKAGLSTNQAHSALQTIKQYVVEKFPMLAGAVDNIFPTTATTTPTTPTTTATDPSTQAAAAAAVSGAHATAAQAHHEDPSFLDKISDYIPGQAGEKIEEFAKKAANGADNLFHKK